MRKNCFSLGNYTKHLGRDMDLIELKAKAYDLIGLLEKTRNELALINQEIAKIYEEQKKEEQNGK